MGCENENANLYYELNLKFNALVLLLANNQRAQAAYEAIVKGSKAKSTAEKHVIKGRERLLSNIGGTTPLAGL
jgi:hypothetical protein